MGKGDDFEIDGVSKAMTVKKFRTYVKEATSVDPKYQNLYFGGKVMHNDCDLCDYKLENGYTIILQQRQPLAEKKEEENGSKLMVKKEEESNTKITIKKELEPEPETSKGEQELSEEERKQK